LQASPEVISFYAPSGKAKGNVTRRVGLLQTFHQFSFSQQKKPTPPIVGKGKTTKNKKKTPNILKIPGILKMNTD